jgi:hypothetical protein
MHEADISPSNAPTGTNLENSPAKTTFSSVSSCNPGFGAHMYPRAASLKHVFRFERNYLVFRKGIFVFSISIILFDV